MPYRVTSWPVLPVLAIILVLFSLYHLGLQPHQYAPANTSLSGFLPWSLQGRPKAPVDQAIEEPEETVENRPTAITSSPESHKPTWDAVQTSLATPDNDSGWKLSLAEPESPAQIPEDKIVIVGRTKSEDTSWIAKELPDWQNAVYSVDNPHAPLHTKNKGHEANPYLTYIIDNYDKLPSVIAFIHPHKEGYPRAWHNDNADYSNVVALQKLNLDFVRSNGYANLRCNPTPGCPDEVQPFRDWDDQDRIPEHVYGRVWKALFNGTQVPEKVATPCCAQFAVSRDQVLARPLSDYVRYHDYLLASPLSDRVLGRVFEYMWHIILGKDPVYCPDIDECYATVYNGYTW